MTRRFWLRLLASMAGCLALMGRSREARADQREANLKETLRSVLRCRLDEEFEFVDKVALKVEQGKLPLDMVLSMMKWARQRRPEIPFPYFKAGIKRRAASIGVDI